MPPAVPAHHPGCETAQHTGCVCKKCRGSMHQCNILYATCWNGNHVPPVLTPSFDSQVRNLFGDRFTSLAISPSTTQKVRREPWILRPRTGKQRTQEEQRILDTTVADCLHFIYSGRFIIDPRRLYTLVQDLTLHSSWSTIINGLSTPATSESSYFWSSMLAAASSAWYSKGHLPTSADISSEVSSHLNLRKIAYPRSTAWKAVAELSSASDVSIAANIISQALRHASSQGISNDEIRIALWLTGSVASPDAWHHPAAVHHCLKPLVEKLRALGAGFSLDSSSELVEDLVDFHLRKRWIAKGAW